MEITPHNDDTDQKRITSHENRFQKKVIIYLSVALAIVSDTSAGVITYLANRETLNVKKIPYKPETGEAGIDVMISDFEEIGMNFSYLETYYGSFTPGAAPPENVSYNVYDTTSPSSAPTRRSMSVLGGLQIISTVTQMVWPLFESSIQVNNGGQISAIPTSYSDWRQISGWRNEIRTAPWGRNYPNCNSHWGQTWVNWQLAFQVNGNYISNARIIANVRAAWGMNVNVRVTPTTNAVNIGTTGNPIAQASFDLFFQSQGGWGAYYTLQATVTFDATGRVSMSPRWGSFC